MMAVAGESMPLILYLHASRRNQFFDESGASFVYLASLTDVEQETSYGRRTCLALAFGIDSPKLATKGKTSMTWRK
jgi:hypothetical protein